jgi:hypothetical protein
VAHRRGRCRSLACTTMLRSTVISYVTDDVLELIPEHGPAPKGIGAPPVCAGLVPELLRQVDWGSEFTRLSGS